MLHNKYTYYLPTKIIFGNNAIQNISSILNGRNVVIITSKGNINRGVLNKCPNGIPKTKLIYDSVKSHPEISDLETCYEKVHQQPFEAILAIGGGSIIDAAKYVSVVPHNGPSAKCVSDMIRNKTIERNYKKIPLISIPTTAGSGSEVTPWATVWDSNQNKKYSLHLSDLFSEVAIYDPLLTLSKPRNLTIISALDALSHALESIWNKNCNDITLNYATIAAKTIFENLPKLINDLENLELRVKIMKACMFASLAFSNTQTSMAHAMSYYVTLKKGICHGIASSFTLPLIIDNIIGKFDYIDGALFDIFGEISSKKLRVFYEQLEISTDFQDYGISKMEMLEIYDSLFDNERASNSLIKPDFLR